ncbi:MAG: hypothetical protein ACE5GD_08060 [Candidatus Geothermarchaeales archaeon]
MEYRRRSLVKSISWRVVAIALNAVKTVFFYIHKRLWDRTSWGRKT